MSNNSKFFQLRYLKSSIIFAVVNIALSVLVGCITNSWFVIVLVFSAFTFVTSGITWLIHFQYLKNDIKWQPFFTPDGFFVRDKVSGNLIKVTGNIKNAFYFKRTAMGRPETGRIPSFTNYYYVEIITVDNNIIYLSCFLAEKFDLATFIQLEFIQQQIPLIRK